MTDKNSEENQEDRQTSDSETLVENANLLPGFYASLHNAEKFFKTSKSLFDNKDYQSSIPLSTISIEESLKGHELLTKFRHNEVLTIEGYEDLKNHKHKLTHVMENAIKDLKNYDKKELENAKKEIEKTGRNLPNIEGAIKNLQNRVGIYSHFQELREGCFYAGWDKLREKWIIFDELSEDMQEALAYFVLVEAEMNITLLKIGIERYINTLRKTGQLLKKVPYPSYIEYRTPDKYESNSLSFPISSKVEQVKYDKGLKIMKQFIEEKSFQFLSFGVFRKTMLEYLKVIAKQEDEKWFPHPMIKAIMMATSSAKKENKEGENIAALAGDADQTYSGKPMITFNVIVKMNSGICEFVKITDMAHPEIEFTQDMVEKIIRTETIIERNQGKEIPANIWIEALNVIGIRTKMIKLEEIPEAIRFAKEMAQSGQWRGVPEDIINQINAIKGAEEWDDLDTSLRVMIASVYGMKKYPEYNSHMTPSDNIRKFKCRQTILFALEKPYLPTA